MSEITNTFRLTIMGLMILSGAINTIGNSALTQLISSKTPSMFMKEGTINSSSTPTCKYLIINPGNHNVLRLVFSHFRLLFHEKERP